MKEALGEHVFQQFIAAKRAEWSEYIAQVHDWEVDRYLGSI
jgi:glutamine synthetase